MIATVSDQESNIQTMFGAMSLGDFLGHFYIKDAYDSKIRILNMIDKFSRKYLTIHFGGKVRSI